MIGVQVFHKIVKFFSHAARLAIAVVNHLVMDETRSLRITFAANMGAFNHRRKLDAVADIARQLITLHDHWDQFMADRTNARNFGGLHVIQDAAGDLNIFRMIINHCQYQQRISKTYHIDQRAAAYTATSVLCALRSDAFRSSTRMALSMFADYSHRQETPEL